MIESQLIFFQRTFPSANMVLIQGPNPILIDSGFGSDSDETVALLHQHDLEPSQLHLLINTHYHCDHAGGNHHLQATYGVRIAAYHSEGRMVNQRDPEACSARWMQQPIDLYHVATLLDDGDIIETGEVALRVVHTPGHTLGHISLLVEHSPNDDDTGTLICGDVFHDDDVAWLNIFREGAGAIYRMLDTLDKLAKLPLKRSYSGHGAAAHNPQQAIANARRRYERWINDPQKIGWHACKRIFTYALMLQDGMTQAEIEAYLLGSYWFHDYSRHVFEMEPQLFIEPLLSEIVRSGAAYWDDDNRLKPSAPYNAAIK